MTTDPECRESTPAGFCVCLSDPDPKSKFLKNRTRIWSHFLFSTVAGVYVVFIHIIFLVKSLLNFGCTDGSRSLNRRPIRKFEKFPDPSPDLSILEQERIGKMWLQLLLVFPSAVCCDEIHTNVRNNEQKRVIFWKRFAIVYRAVLFNRGSAEP